MLALMLGLLCLGADANLLENTTWAEDFAGWNRAGAPLEVIRETDEDGVYLVLRTPMDVEPSWRHVSQSLPSSPGERFEFQVEARGIDYKEGRGPLASVQFFNDENQRVGYSDAYGFVPTMEWRSLTARGEAPEGATQVRAAMMLHGRGEVQFRSPALRQLPDAAPLPESSEVAVRVRDEVSVDSLIGFGAEDDGWFYNEQNAQHGVDEEGIAIREGRIRYMNPDWIRMFFWYRDWNPSLDGETYTWDSDNMQSHYRTLDLYQELGARVTIAGVEWTYTEQWKDPESLARAIGDLLEHLIVTKGYTCIQDWTLSNEPNLFFHNGEEGSFERFIEIHMLVAEEIERRGLDVNIVGSDDGDGLDWFQACVHHENYHALTGLYASHTYFNPPDLPFVRDFFEDRLALLRAHPPERPFVMAEFGFTDDRTAHPSTNPLMEEYPYALLTMSAYMDGLNAGVAGFSIWCMQEVYYPGASAPMNFGLWHFADRNWEIRPVFHAVSTLARLTSAGDTAYRTESSAPEHFKAAATDDVLFWVNLSDQPLDVALEGFSGTQLRVMTAKDMDSDRETGQISTLEDPTRFQVPAQSFGYLR